MIDDEPASGLLLAPVAFVACLFLVYDAYASGQYAVSLLGTDARRHASGR